MLLTDQISLSYCLYFLKCWAISVWQSFVNQVVFIPDKKVKTKT